MFQELLQSDKSVIETIPPAQQVREKLGQHVRETKILRKMLQLAEQAERERLNRKGGPHAHA